VSAVPDGDRRAIGLNLITTDLGMNRLLRAAIAVEDRFTLSGSCRWEPMAVAPAQDSREAFAFPARRREGILRIRRRLLPTRPPFSVVTSTRIMIDITTPLRALGVATSGTVSRTSRADAPGARTERSSKRSPSKPLLVPAEGPEASTTRVSRRRRTDRVEGRPVQQSTRGSDHRISAFGVAAGPLDAEIQFGAERSGQLGCASRFGT